MKEPLKTQKRITKMLKEIRIEKGISLRQMEEMTGIFYSNLCLVESGKHSPTLSLLVRMATPLGYRITLEPIDENDTE